MQIAGYSKRIDFMPVITNNSGPPLTTKATDISHPPSPEALRPIHLTKADGIRAVACLWVMLAHLFMELPNAFQLTAQPWVLVYRGHAGVGIFFVLSGFLLSQPFGKAFLAGTALPNLRIYWSRRLARIVPGYWCCVLLTAAASGLLSTRWDIFTLLLTLFFLNSAFAATYAPAFNPPLWSISVEMWFYLFLPLTMMVMFRFRTVRSAIAFLLGLMATLVVAQWLFLLIAPWIETTVNDKSWFSTSESAWATHQNPPAMYAAFSLWCNGGLGVAGVGAVWPCASDNACQLV